jgi:hypothetical protein
MKYMLLFVEETGAVDKIPEAKRNEVYARIGQWWGELSQQGKIHEGHQLQPPQTATTVKLNGGTAVVTDGPFAESKETIGGYGIIHVADLDEAIAIAKTWPGGLMSAKVEVRPLVEREEM